MTARSDLGHSSDRIVADFKGFIGDAEELLRAVSDLSGESVANARARFQDRLTEVKSLVSEGREMAINKARQAAAGTDEYVHQRPWQAIGLGVAIGMAIGYLSHRR